MTESTDGNKNTTTINYLENEPESAESAILKAISSIRYGSVEVTIHDSRIVQIECRKKVRIQTG
jgi:hypothetical protein